MASDKKVTWWALIGSLWTAWWLFIMIWITWFDYPKDVNIYAGWIHDASWYWHEMALPVSIWFFGMLCLLIWQLTWYVYTVNQCLHGLMKRIEKGV